MLSDTAEFAFLKTMSSYKRKSVHLRSRRLVSAEDLAIRSPSPPPFDLIPYTVRLGHPILNLD